MQLHFFGRFNLDYGGLNFMDNNINENDLRLEYPDFNKLYTFKCEIRKAPKNTLFKVPKAHFFIYLITLIISVFLCIQYFPVDVPNNYQTVLMSVGASGVGAALLGYFIEVAITSSERNRKIKSYNSYIISIYYNLWLVFGCGSYSYLNDIHSSEMKQNRARHSADEFIFQFKHVIPQIENLVLEHGEWFDEYTAKSFDELKSNLIEFIASLQNPIDTAHLIQLLDGVRVNLRQFFNLLKMKKLFIGK